MAISAYRGRPGIVGPDPALKDLDAPVRDQHLLIIEDIVDTGLTNALLKTLRFAAPPRSRSARTRPATAGWPTSVHHFTATDDFVVGYRPPAALPRPAGHPSWNNRPVVQFGHGSPTHMIATRGCSADGADRVPAGSGQRRLFVILAGLQRRAGAAAAVAALVLGVQYFSERQDRPGQLGRPRGLREGSRSCMPRSSSCA
jgi:hypothetical protein